jgi:hypothetical protein
MPLKKLVLKPGVNRENTRYANENGWYECDKVRFRQGTPERIGGWKRISSETFQGVCRSLWNWVTLIGNNLMGVGTNLKFYIEQGGQYYDATPLRATTTLTNPFTATDGSAVITVAHTAHGASTGDFVTFTGATGLGGNITAALLNKEHQVTVTSVNAYTITVAATANATDAAGSPGGGSVTAAYQITVGNDIQAPLLGWGAGTWGSGTWGVGTVGTATANLRLWSQADFGEDLIFAPRYGEIYYWDATGGVGTRGILLSSMGGTFTVTIASPAVVTLSTPLPNGTPIQLATTGALPTGLTTGVTYYVENADGLTCNLAATAGGAPINTSGSQSGTHSIAKLMDVPTVQNLIFVSDISRFVFAFGCNDYGASTQDPMLIRWSDQESAISWTPQATNQAGSLTLSRGSEIITALQTRQEILVWTDAALYSLQYLGAPAVWGSQILADNISIQWQNAVAVASNVVYWMGRDKFYVYDGTVKTLPCDLRRYIFNDFNPQQNEQVFAGTNEGFNEVWWFYCSADSTTIDRYVVYNYVENIWYYGTMARTAWIDSGLRPYPVAATYSNNLVDHENGVDDVEEAEPRAVNAYIASSEFDIEDGHSLGFVWRILPDVTFDGSTAASPSITMTLIPMLNSGSGYNNPQSEGGSSYAAVTRSATVPIEQFSGQVYVRVRGRQLIMRIESNQLGTIWQLGYPRLDIRPDGRR